MSDAELALRLDDVGAASKRFEVYGVTRVPIGRWQVPFPGNFLFLKYLPPVKRWGPYPELTASAWERILEALAAVRARMTVALTAGWVETDGSVVPFQRKFPEAAAVVREGARYGVLEVANHGYTHCVLQDGLFRPRAFSGNRRYHREFHEWLSQATHREHVRRAQDILQEFFGMPVVTFVPPGNVFTRATLECAAEAGLRYLSCLDAGRYGEATSLTAVPDDAVLALHDRDVVVRGLPWLQRLLSMHPQELTTVRALGERLEKARR